MKILIADSGSTKTDWCLADERGAITYASTQGINPVHQTDEQIACILNGELPKDFLRQANGVGQVYYYGAGALPTVAPRLERLLADAFFGEGGSCEGQRVSVASDLLGAARALFGVQEGIACILGTGSNSGLYDGKRLVANTPPLGYILGDEGSGAVLGRHFLGSLCKGLLSPGLYEEFQRQTGLDTAAVIQKVYREPLPNRFLAQTTRFIHQHLQEEGVCQLVVDNFRAFFRRNLVQYGRRDLPVRVIGSVAYYFREQLVCAAEKEEFAVDGVAQTPMPGLIDYHTAAL
ncbi:MAG: ATPase [Prevotella sp.]|nr:ATPase [Prevotella sp.]